MTGPPSSSEPSGDGAGSGTLVAERIVDHILVIRINRPHRRNSFDGSMARAMEALIDDFDSDDDLRCAILTGSDSVFCAGQDLIAAAHGDIASSPKRGGFGIIRVPPTKPIIAAVEGAALGGGLELCLACDLIVASRAASMGLPEATRSLVATGGGVLRLPKRIPYHLAMELVLTGKAWPAPRMAEIGLVNRLAEPGKALESAVELAADVVLSGPLAVVAAKQIVQRTYDWAETDAWVQQADYIRPVLESDDWEEGIRAFAEKRRPVWKGR